MVFNSFALSFSVLAGPICLVNLAFMILLYNKGSLNSLKNGLLFSLACSDFCVGSITIPFIVFSTVEKNASCKFHIASYLLTRLFSVSAAIHLLAIVYERFLKIVYPFWFNVHEMRLRSVRIVLAIWFASVLISTIPLCWLYSERCDVELEEPSENDYYTEIYDYACMALILVLLVLMVFAFARVYFVVRAHLSAIRAIAVPPNGSKAGVMTPDLNVSANGEMEEENDTLNAASSHSTLPSSGVRSPERSITRTSSPAQSDPGILGRLNKKSRRYWFIKEARVVVRFAAMVFMFAFVWITYCVLSIMDRVGRPVANHHFRLVVSVMQFLTSLFNPLIMTINNQDFQSTWTHFSSCLYRVLRCCCPQSQPSLANSRGEAVTAEREIPLICTNTVLH